MPLSDIVVIGGGVIGSAIAYNLVRAGARVTVLERDRVGSGASGVGAGIMSVVPEHDRSSPLFRLASASLALLRDTCAVLRDETGLDPEYVPVGLLRVAFTEAEEAALKDLRTWVQLQRMEADWIDHDDLLHTEPALSEEIRGALYTTAEHQVRASKLTQTFARAAANRGAMYRLGCPVAGLACHGQRVTGVRLADGSHVSADHVVIAAGAWSGQLVGDLGLQLPVRPVKGQLVHLYAVPRIIRLTVMHGIGYVTPKVDGTVVVGATQEEAGFDTRSTAEGVGAMLTLGPRLVPALGQAEVAEVKVGLRPGTPDGLPILGPAPGWDGLTIATGHFRSGVVLSPITGKLIAESILTGAPDPLLAPFTPARFA